VVGRTLDRMAIAHETVARVTARLGHFDLRVEPAGGRFVVTCSCGYRSTGRRYERHAAQAGIHHLEAAFKRFAASGQMLPQIAPLRDARVEHPSERQTSRIA